MGTVLGVEPSARELRRLHSLEEIDGSPISDSELTEAERVVKLRELVTARGGLAGAERWCEDSELLRFVRARATIDGAMAMFEYALERRFELARNWDVDLGPGASFGSEQAALLARRGEAGVPVWWSFLETHLPFQIYGADRQGLPVTYFALGRADLAGLEREVGLEALQRYCIYQNDFFLDAARAVNRGEGRSEVGSDFDELRTGGVLIVDMEGMNWMQMRAKVQICGAIAEGAHSMHPERQRRSFIVRAPMAFSAMWRLASKLMDPRTAEKACILGARDSLTALFEEVGAANVPDFLGGESKAVPRSSPGAVARGALAAHGAANGATLA